MGPLLGYWRSERLGGRNPGRGVRSFVRSRTSLSPICNVKVFAVRSSIGMVGGVASFLAARARVRRRRDLPAGRLEREDSQLCFISHWGAAAAMGPAAAPLWRCSRRPAVRAAGWAWYAMPLVAGRRHAIEVRGVSEGSTGASRMIERERDDASAALLAGAGGV